MALDRRRFVLVFPFILAASTACSGTVADDAGSGEAGSETEPDGRVSDGTGGAQGDSSHPAESSAPHPEAGGSSPVPDATETPVADATPASEASVPEAGTADGAPPADAADAEPCVERTPPDYGPFDCSELDRVAMVDPVLVDQSGDAVVSPGETATLTVQMQDVSGYGFNWYPTALFTTDDARVQASGATIYYALLVCSREAFTSTLTFSPSIPPGTTVHVTATAASLGIDCPGAPSIDVAIVVGN